MKQCGANLVSLWPTTKVSTPQEKINNLQKYKKVKKTFKKAKMQKRLLKSKNTFKKGKDFFKTKLQLALVPFSIQYRRDYIMKQSRANLVWSQANPDQAKIFGQPSIHCTTQVVPELPGFPPATSLVLVVPPRGFGLVNGSIEDPRTPVRQQK